MTEQEKKLKHLIVDMLEYLEDVIDDGPPGEGWRSEKLIGVIDRAREAIGEIDKTGSDQKWINA